MRRSKALFSVVREATVTDESGNTLDLDELFGTQEQQGEQTEPTEQTEQPAEAAKAE